MKRLLLIGLLGLASIVSAAEEDQLNRELFFLAQEDKPEGVEGLIAQGADPSWRWKEDPSSFRSEVSDKYKPTVLHNAHPACVASLINAGADIRLLAYGVAEGPQSIFGCRLFEAFTDPTSGDKEALKLFFKRDDFPEGLTHEEVIKEVKSLNEFTLSTIQLKELVQEICPSEVAQAVYGDVPK